jgi:putative flavoprotein involved in K+ transport
MADYLEAYAGRFELPVRTGVRVERLAREDGRFVVTTGDRRLEADRVVVATGAHRTPRVPAFAADLGPGIVQLHSSDYRNPSQLPDGDVLVVGVGNSGAEIAFELARTRPTWLAGKEAGEIPVRHGSRAGRLVLPVFRFLGHHVLTVRTPIGRRVGPKLAHGATPLIRVKTKDLSATGVKRVSRVMGVRDGLPLFEGGQVLEVASVVWSTGYRQDFSWIDLPILDADGQPVHERGVVTSEPGLYFVGLVFQYAATSDILPGVGRDAERVATHLARLGPAAVGDPPRRTTTRALEPARAVAAGKEAR